MSEATNDDYLQRSSEERKLIRQKDNQTVQGWHRNSAVLSSSTASPFDNVTPVAVYATPVRSTSAARAGTGVANAVAHFSSSGTGAGARRDTAAADSSHGAAGARRDTSAADSSHGARAGVRAGVRAGADSNFLYKSGKKTKKPFFFVFLIFYFI